MNIYRKLYSSIGPRGWWPAESTFEIVIGAILAQNTSWKNVKKAVNNLKSKNLLSPETLFNTDTKVVAEMIKSSGYYNQKAEKIKNFLEYFKRYDYSFERMTEQDLEELRGQLIKINGIGEETADSILLYALEKPVFVIDAYTKRIFSRLGFISEKIKYSELQRLFTSNLKKDTALFNEYHALIDYLAHFICRKKPECQKCVLNDECSYYNG
ncbi:MAG: endonuclease III domain-containing protein [Candidatus Helarchaeota archaeon]|nr:endonuclease III domain-containing protein [Candidatus Helarchaeota archaeon]